MKKHILTALVGLSLLLFAGAGAQAGMNFGVKSVTFHNSLIPMDQALGSYFGFDVSPSVVVLGGLDYGRLGVKTEIGVEGFDTDTEVSASYMLFHAGVKFYLKPRQQGNVCPYILGGFEKTMTSLDAGGLGETVAGLIGIDVDEEDIIGPIEDVLSPFGIMAAFGSEYYFSDNFGIGGEVGVRILSSSGEIELPELADIKVTLSRYFIYSGFSFNFRL
jgi:hypothetical protein